ncbi:helix-turn-helix domain-containing protein [Desulfoscipio gibsoniae]|uniref:Putative transcription factor, MBF1 like protein n=1 Tax=Desulfoscipio gibsoniae DSM 7213 TaxID=767817 RepID=R4KJQ4_9FIRM|nr:helix-turn-helix transcriptional regulator [Desulfoscipio gibsoniae]AGL02859.1 putative transcription factor, MBF1 like protein [Desulfoscipio gibsoniae DSM 7213]
MKIYWYNGSKNIIGERVREARKKSTPPLTQQDLSAKLGVLGFNIDRVSISKIEAGDRFVADYEVIAIAQALNVSLNWLLTGSN